MLKPLMERKEEFAGLTRALWEAYEQREKANFEMRLRKQALMQFMADEKGPLSPREREIFNLMSAGRSNKDISNRLGIGVRTVKFHASSILKKLGIESRKQLLNF